MSFAYYNALVLILLASSCSAFSLLKPKFSPVNINSKYPSEHALHAIREPIRMPTSTPMVPYKPPGSDVAQFVDIYSRMMRDRILLVGKFIDEAAANEIISILLFLRKEDSTGPITLYFNVPGAQLRPALAIYDLICQTRENCEISTVNLGLCTGMGALLCGAGTKGRRCAMPNSRFLLQRTGMETPFQGQASDIGLEVSNMKVMNDKMEKELSKMTGQTVEQVLEDMTRDFYLSSEEAVRYGLIDKVLLPAPRKRATQGQDADLGAFEGEGVQKYQKEKSSGFGGGWKDESANTRGDDKDYEPPSIKE